MTRMVPKPISAGSDADAAEQSQAAAACDPVLTDATRPRNGTTTRSVLFLLLGFLTVLLLTNPAGNFPLNDDWSYSQAVRDLVQNHKYLLTNSTSMPLLTQVLWGALFSLPAGIKRICTLRRTRPLMTRRSATDR